jgi:hypothetical protein
MNETWILIWGILAFLLAVGPLAVAAYLDNKDRGQE